MDTASAIKVNHFLCPNRNNRGINDGPVLSFVIYEKKKTNH